MTDSPRSKLIEIGLDHLNTLSEELQTPLPGTRTWSRTFVDALLAHRDLLLEALDGQQVECNGSQATVLDFTDVQWWRFPALEDS